MIYSYFPREGEVIAEATDTEGVIIVSGGSFHKDKYPTVASDAYIIESFNPSITCSGAVISPRHENGTLDVYIF